MLIYAYGYASSVVSDPEASNDVYICITRHAASRWDYLIVDINSKDIRQVKQK